MRAVRFTADGQQTGLAPIALRGRETVDPVSSDFFRHVVEARQRLKTETASHASSCDCEDCRTHRFLKVLANSGSYGIYAEMIRKELPAGTKAAVTVHGPEDDPFNTRIATGDAAEVEVVIEYVEVTSGANGIERREQFPEMLARLEAGDIDGIVLPDLTRLSRKLTTQEALLAAIWARGGRVFTSDGHEVPHDDPDDPMRTAMRQMAGVFAQLDRAMIAKRLRDGRKAKARDVASRDERYAWSFAPFGYRKDGGRLVPDDDSPAWEAITLILQQRTSGARLRKIADALNERQLPTPSGRGAGWTPAQVSRVLAREGDNT